MSKVSHKLGKKGERLAVSHLMKEGYMIDKVNYRCPFGEIDIIARDEGVLVFVEVKTRMNERFGSAVEAVDYHKKQKINRIALYYLGSMGEKKEQEMCRFDVISIDWENKTGWRVELIRDAFPCF